ncbi:hypothetical protein PsW74_01791 [Pseudovibrio sp. W74]|nr:hypothetical protein PsW74_01791 [Pseudovibrio sp. W74]
MTSDLSGNALHQFLTLMLVSSISMGMLTRPATAQSETLPSSQKDQAPVSDTASEQPATPQALKVPPGYYSQVDQSLGVLLSIYDAPSDDAAVIVQLPGDTILNSDGQQKRVDDLRWQHVSLGEIEGWVEAQKLKAAIPVPFTGTNLPVLGVCGGTEPSWSIEWNSSVVTYSNITGLLHRVPFQSVKAETDKNTTLLQAGNESIDLKMTISEKQCTFTPLDSFVWGEAVATITQPGQKPLTLKGCCRPVSDGYR